jgi:hypothetical protein
MAPKDSKRPGSMVAPKSQEQLQPVEDLAAERGMPEHALAGMMRANGWVEGKQMTGLAFESAMTAYIKRPMGSGRN